MQTCSFDVIGTHLDLRIDSLEDCDTLFAEIRGYLARFEAKYSRFLEGNWLHDLNTSRRGILDPEGRYMLEYMLDLARTSEGYFDPTVGKRLVELGYGKSVKSEEGKITNKSAVPVIPARPLRSETKYGSTLGVEAGVQVPKKGNYRDIEIVGDEVILHGDIMLEFGGVGKGYLIDVIKEIMNNGLCHIDRNSHVSVANEVEISCPENPARFLVPLEMIETRYLINFGGDIYGKGGWKVGLESPFASDEVIGTIVLEDNFLACSAGTRRKWGTHHHLIDPHTGESAREVIASYVEGSSGIVTDAYATTLCVMPWDRAVDTLEKTPEISGVIVRHDGAIYQKRGSRAAVFL